MLFSLVLVPGGGERKTIISTDKLQAEVCGFSDTGVQKVPEDAGVIFCPGNRMYIVCILPYKMACCSVMMSDDIKHIMYSEIYVVFHGGVMVNGIALEFMCYSNLARLTAHPPVKA